jgi:NAD(P)-dependent dehydrogenase (short-subunit alcohol dehydrogenase family)
VGQGAQGLSRESLAGRVALVTGGARGIGRAVVEVFLREGAAVLFCDRDEDVGVSTAADIDVPGRCLFVPADVSSEADVAHMVAVTVERLGPPTVLVNNAGVTANFDATTMTGDDWDGFMGIDLKAAWLTAKYALPHMVTEGRGSIVNVASMHGFATLPGFFPYAAAKSGLVGLTRSLALDWGPKGVRVNCVAPGFIRTRLVQDSIDRHPDPVAAEAKMVEGIALQRIADPLEVAEVIRFFASDESSYVTGASLLVDGGVTARRAG